MIEHVIIWSHPDDRASFSPDCKILDLAELVYSAAFKGTAAPTWEELSLWQRNLLNEQVHGVAKMLATMVPVPEAVVSSAE